MGFGKEFIWGAATAACQVEGAAKEEGKGPHIWDIFAAHKGKIFGGHTPEYSTDHYHRWKDDVMIMKEMGLRAYRFSISWTRILPDGTGRINQKGIDFYNHLIDELMAGGIEPYITLYHWDLPYALHLQGGWSNRKVVDWFAGYAKIIAECFSDRVTHYFTLNEPQGFVGLGYLLGMHAPGQQVAPEEGFQIAHNILLAHGAAVKALREYAKQPIQIGVASCGDVCFPDSDKKENVEAAREKMFSAAEDPRGMGNCVTWFADPIYLGHYPEDGLKKYGKYLPHYTDMDMEAICQPLDFMGQNIYQENRIYLDKDGNIKKADLYEGFPTTACGWPVTPECMYWGTKFLFERYGLPVYISENGISCHDVISLDGRVHDPGRIDYMERYLAQLQRTVEDGIPVRGYFAWSLLDNYEWASGYSQRFGLIYVDYRTKERIWKDSAFWYKDKIAKESGEICYDQSV